MNQDANFQQNNDEKIFGPKLEAEKETLRHWMKKNAYPSSFEEMEKIIEKNIENIGSKALYALYEGINNTGDGRTLYLDTLSIGDRDEEISEIFTKDRETVCGTSLPRP